MEKIFRRCELRHPCFVRREPHLPRQPRDAIDPESRHHQYYPAVLIIGQQESDAKALMFSRVGAAHLRRPGGQCPPYGRHLYSIESLAGRSSGISDNPGQSRTINPVASLNPANGPSPRSVFTRQKSIPFTSSSTNAGRASSFIKPISTFSTEIFFACRT